MSNARAALYLDTGNQRLLSPPSSCQTQSCNDDDNDNDDEDESHDREDDFGDGDDGDEDENDGNTENHDENVLHAVKQLSNPIM